MMGLDFSADTGPVLLAFGAYLVGVVLFSTWSHRLLTKGSFVKNYFVGGRGLGAWVLALTVAATAVSGGTFMGFPSLIYTNGWVMALWICSYMAVPLTTMALMGKRINQVARIAGSVTVPDVLRDRFASPLLGIVATLAILLFVSFNLIAQFKAGGLVLREAMALRPPAAEFLGAKLDDKNRAVLTFRSADGETDEQIVPLPDGVTLDLERTRTNADLRTVTVVYQPVEGARAEKTVSYPPAKVTLPGWGVRAEWGYLIGLVLFAGTVVAYTTYGGFWAVTMTDVFEGLVMLAGVIVMAILAVQAVPAILAPSGETLTGLAAATEHLRQTDPNLVFGPGPGNFLPVMMALSFFMMWSMSSAGQPSGLVRLMAFKDTPSLRRAMVLVVGYYLITYLSLVVIFVCARAIYPTEYLKDVGTEGVPDSIMPAMARRLAPSPFIAGVLLAAPFAAIMSTVAAFLLMISSSLVRDLYQRSINAHASDRTLQFASYGATAIVGLIVMVGAVNPPSFLQYIIVFTGTGQSCAFLIPMFLTLYWRRATRLGVLAGMLGGGGTVFGLYLLGWTDSRTRGLEAWQSVRDALSWFPGWGEPRLDSFAPLYVFGCDPLIWGFLASLILTIGVSLLTRPDERLTAKYFPEG